MRKLWRARIADLVPHRRARAIQARKHHVEIRNCFAQSLKGGAAAAEIALRPGKQHANALFLGKLGKSRCAPNGKQSVQLRIPEIQ